MNWAWHHASTPKGNLSREATFSALPGSNSKIRLRFLRSKRRQGRAVTQGRH